MKPSQSKATKPYPSIDSTFLEAIHRMEMHELNEEQRKIAVNKRIIKNRAIRQLKEEIKEILKAEPIARDPMSKVNARIIKLERVIEEHYNPEQITR